jgi:hypothetical protein
MESPLPRRPVRASRLDGKHRKHAKSAQASAISNGRLLPNMVDGRSAWCRRVKDLIAQHVSDLGGESNISSAEQALVRRCATLITELERREMMFAQVSMIDDEALIVYQTATNSLRRTLETLGLKRRSRDVTPSLSQYLDNRVDREAAEQ